MKTRNKSKSWFRARNKICYLNRLPWRLQWCRWVIHTESRSSWIVELKDGGIPQKRCLKQADQISTCPHLFGTAGGPQLNQLEDRKKEAEIASKTSRSVHPKAQKRAQKRAHYICTKVYHRWDLVGLLQNRVRRSKVPVRRFLRRYHCRLSSR